MGAIIKIAAAVFLIAAAGVIWFGYPATPPPAGVREFFTDNDGDTWFADDANKVTPFDHNGKPAVLARVFQAPNGRPFVGYMMKFGDAARAEIADPAAAHHAVGGISASTAPASEGLLVKKPHQAKWISDSDPKARDVKTITSPEGSTNCLPVRP